MTEADIYTLMPIIITGCAAIVVLVAGHFTRPVVTTAVGVACALGAGCWAALTPAATAPGSLPGVTYTPLAHYLVPLLCLTAALSLLFAHGYNLRHGVEGEEFTATVLFSLFAMCVLPCATNLLTLFLALESIAFSFYILVAFDLRRAQSGEAGLKYLLIGAVAAATIAFGIALFFVATGSLALTATSASTANRVLITAGWGMILLGIAFKLSLVPAHLWTPDVYQGAPAPVAGFLSTGSKTTALAALLMLLAFLPPIQELHAPLYLLSLLSMVLGNLAALQQQDLKRMLAYSSIAHMGYLALAILTGAREGYAAVLLYAVIYTVMTLAAFGAVASLSSAEERSSLAGYAGLGYSAPFRGAVLALAMLSLAGVPPTAGFMGKFFIFYSALRGGETVLAIIGMVSAAISAFFYLRVVAHLYMHKGSDTPQPATVSETFSLAVCAIAVLVIGVFPAPLLRMVDAALG